MKTKELIENLKDFAEVYEEKPFIIFGTYWTVKKDAQSLVIFGRIPNVVAQWLAEYTATPIEEREEEKKYEIAFEEQVLAKKDDGNFYFLWDYASTIYQRTFTKSEIDNFPRVIKGAIECGFLKKVEVEE